MGSPLKLNRYRSYSNTIYLISVTPLKSFPNEKKMERLKLRPGSGEVNGFTYSRLIYRIMSTLLKN